MRLLGFNITRAAKSLSPVSPRGGGGWRIISEAFAGAWQQNVEIKQDSVLSNHADFACRTLIASDISKLRVKLVRNTGDDGDNIWQETTNSAYSPVLRKPNPFQNRIQFFESWVLSKLQYGNTYVLKRRDGANRVSALYVLDPKLVTPMVADDGSVFYELQTDKLLGYPETIRVPAREIIHDRFNCFFHPLVGISPIMAGGLAAMQALAIQDSSTSFFQNGARPGGILSATNELDDKDAEELKAYFNEQFSGKNRGKIAIVGGGLAYHGITEKAVDAQLIEQLKWTADVVCSVYHVPPHKIGME